MTSGLIPDIAATPTTPTSANPFRSHSRRHVCYGSSHVSRNTQAVRNDVVVRRDASVYVLVAGTLRVTTGLPQQAPQGLAVILEARN